MPGRSYRKRRRRLKVKAVVALCAIVIGLTGISAFAYTHFFAGANAAPAGKSDSSQTSSSTSPTANKTAALTSSARESSSSAAKTDRVSPQDAAAPLWIDVSIEHQTVTVYDANKQIVESWPCSTGSPGYDTPRGTFSVYYRCKYFWSSAYQEGAEYAVEFVQHYYLHSVPLDKNNHIIPSIANDLGHEDSHGCVHLAMANSEWIYKNIPDGTKVVVD
jgi:Uncharacterized protein conserved in bacteria